MRALPRSLIVIVLSLLSSSELAQPKSVRKSLESALAAGEVHAEFTSNGSSSGDSIVVTVAESQSPPRIRAYGQVLPPFADLIDMGGVCALNFPVSANPGLARVGGD
jgi:hypothetical protein